MDFPGKFQVIVVGGGHAGTEAALAAARMGAETLLLTHSIETLGQMSCNPAIGGIGKSHLVREVDALGGTMAEAADHAGIQFRVLNARKGPAVRATRAQTDRALYRAFVRQRLENQPNLTLFQDAAEDLIVAGDECRGVVTRTGIRFTGEAVVLTTGTFLGGVIHIGMESHPGGRAGDPPANTLSRRLRAMPFRISRLKTGTPPRIDGRSVDFSRMESQWGDEPVPVMSFLGQPAHHPRQICCYITHTNARTHAIIRDGFDRSPMFSGVIEGVGPRYCPSIEDKVHRYADKDSHQIFVEPEGLHTRELYPNGISTSLPFDIQLAAVRSIAGFERAHISRPGYAIEYDFLDPRDLYHWLESRLMPGLFLAGQINGTTGYEEAAAQGLLAGLNAARRAASEPPWYPQRDQAYLGVLVDDLVSLGTREPYRMFTSRAEYRLQLRQDNADLRLTETGRTLGLVDEHRWEAFCRKRDGIAREEARLRSCWVHPGSLQAESLSALLANPISHEYCLMELLRRPELDYDTLLRTLALAPAEAEIAEQVEISARYAGYIERQAEEVRKLRTSENIELPESLDYSAVSGLSNEVRQVLAAARPANLGQAARLPGVTPAAISLLLVWLRKRQLERAAAGDA